MALTTSVITGRLPFADDTVPDQAVLRFTLSGVDTQGFDVLHPSERRATLVNGSIPAGFVLWRNSTGSNLTTYNVDLTVIFEDQFGGRTVERNYPLGKIQIGGASTYELADLIEVPPDYLSIEDYLAELAAMAADGAAAAASATAAAASATNAALYSPAYFKDLAALVANTTAWPVGTVLNTRVEGASYEVLSPSATDHNLTKGGGQKLRVNPGQLGYSSKAFGQAGTERIVYPATETTKYVSDAFSDASGNWWTPIRVTTTGPIEVWVAWGQSEMRGVTNSPAAIGGDRKARDNVLSYVRGTTIAGVADGWYAVGPEDDAWPFASSLNAVGSAFYLAAAKRAEEIGGTVCIVPYAIGGAESGLFLQGGSMWTGLQASWSGALAATLPGRGMSLTGMNKTLADVLLVWQGSADADYKLGTGDAAATADDWVVRWRTIINSMIAPSGLSIPVIEANRTKIVFFEMLHGATGGGAPGVGNPTDSRNRDLHKLLKTSSSKRAQIAIVPMAGVNNATTNPDVIGTPDNLHPNGAAYNEISNRLQVVLEALNPTDRNDVYFENSSGYTIIRPDGTFTSWSKDVVSPNNVAVAYGTGFRTSNATWTFPMPAGYIAEVAPNVATCQCTTPGTTFPRAHVGAVTTTTATVYAVSDATIADLATMRFVATGLWVKT